MLQSVDFISDVKDYLRMRRDVTIYDGEITGLIDAAITTLKIAGVNQSKTPLVTEFVKTYVRTRMLQDATPTFRDFELQRENVLIQQLTYGGETSEG